MLSIVWLHGAVRSAVGRGSEPAPLPSSNPGPQRDPKQLNKTPTEIKITIFLAPPVSRKPCRDNEVKFKQTKTGQTLN